MDSNILNNFTSGISNIKNSISSNLESTTNKIDNVKQNISNKIPALNKSLEDTTNSIKNTTTGISNTFNNFGEKIMNAIPYDSSRYLKSSGDFINSNNFIAKIIFIVLVVILFVALFKFGISMISLLMAPNGSPYLFKDMKDAKQVSIISQDPKSKGSIPVLRSRNQYDGLEFSYSVWIYIDDPTYREDQMYKHIFHKGNDYLGNDSIYYPNNSPGLYLYNGKQGHIENPGKINNYDYKYPVMGLLVRQNIFTNENKNNDIYEDIYIEGIPIKKWVNIVVRVDNQNIMDVFINSKMMKRKKLSGIVRQNYDNIFINMNGGFSGFLSGLRYFNYSIGTFDITSIVAAGPSLKMDSTNIEQTKPSYLSAKWFFSETNPLYN